MNEITSDELREVCDLTLKLTELRQNECKHLCIENIAPEIFHSLLTRLSMHKRGLMRHMYDPAIIQEIPK